MKKTLVASMIAAGIMVAGVAVAAPDYSGFQGKGAGWYAGANVGYGMANWKASDLTFGTNTGVPVSVKDKNGVTYGILGGYMFNNNLGLEVAYDFFQDTKFEALGQTVGKIKNQNYFSVSSVFNVPVNPQWDVFFKLGGAYLNPKMDMGSIGNSSAKVWAAQFALGAGYMVNANVELTAQYKHIMGSKANVHINDGIQDTLRLNPGYDAFTVGAVYKF